jgi:hypothetical protein
MGVPDNYKPFFAPLIPNGSTACPPTPRPTPISLNFGILIPSGFP